MFKRPIQILILLMALNAGGPTGQDWCVHKAKSCKPHRPHNKIIASWYGPGFDGRTTANGEIYDQLAMTVASRTLPFGTMIRLCYRLNCVKARVTDRGPFIEGRDLDVSMGVAEKLGFKEKGVTTLFYAIDKQPKL